MAELTAIREALAASLEGTFEGQISPRMLANPTPPTVHVFPDEIEPHLAMQNGAETWNLIVEALVGMVSDEGAQLQLDQYLDTSGSSSLMGALEKDQSLGGLVSGVTVTRISGYRQYQLGGTQGLALGSQWTVSVLV
jgi:hypothetical protein